MRILFIILLCSCQSQIEADHEYYEKQIDSINRHIDKETKHLERIERLTDIGYTEKEADSILSQPYKE